MNIPFRRLRRIMVAVLISIAAVSAGRAQSNTAAVTYYGLTFPAEIGGAPRISVRDYESQQPGLGSSAGYRHGSATSTVYIYDAGRSAIPDDLKLALLTTGHFDQLKAEVRRAQPADVTVEETHDFLIVDAAKMPRVVCQGYILKTKSIPKPLDTFACLGVAYGKFFKVRTTMPQLPDSEAEVRRFIGLWVSRIWS